LWTFAAAKDQASRLGGIALANGLAVAIEWPSLQRFKRSFTDPVPESSEASFARSGIEVRHGVGRFAGPDTVEVAGEPVVARHVLIATGATPMPLPIEGADLLATSDDFLDLEELPRDIVLIGGGYIAFEIAHIACRAGARVTILEREQQPLSGFDASLVQRLVEHSRGLGIRIELGAQVTRVSRAGTGYRVAASRGEERLEVEAAYVVHASGRIPAIADLRAEKAGIETEDGRLLLEPDLRTVGNERVFAAGDAAQRGPALTPVATIDARAVAATLLGGGSHEPDYEAVPSVVFTIPPLTRVDMTPEEAGAAGLEHEVCQGDMSGFQSVQRVAEKTAAFRIVLDRGGHILGAHLLGPHAEEVINLFALAMRAGTTADQLRELSTAYPSFSSNISRMLS
jgi:glutathione reductase (NADPH)